MDRAFPPAGILPNFKASLSIAENSSWILVSQNPDTKNNLPYIQETGLFFTYRDYYTQRSDLPSYLFLYTLKGEGELYLETLDRPKYALTPGTLCWVDCTQLHKYACPVPQVIGILSGFTHTAVFYPDTITNI